MVDRRAKLCDLPFSFRATRNGTVFVARQGNTVTTLRGHAAEEFLRKIAGLDDQAAQLVMARVTGQYKHGNER